MLVLVAVGVFVCLVSPDIPDPLSIPGKNVVAFAIVLLGMFLPHSVLAQIGSNPVVQGSFEPGPPDRLALNCSRLC
jgi:hypothetical protein